MTLVFVDPHAWRGGGQVVLEELMHHLQGVLVADGAGTRVALVSPNAANLDLPDFVEVKTLIEVVSTGVDRERRIVLVSNANRSHLRVLLLGLLLRLRRRPVTRVAIVHSMPTGRARLLALGALLRGFERTVVVAPVQLPFGVKRDTRQWLGLSRRHAANLSVSDAGCADLGHRKTIKVFARPDPVKGLHLLPQVMAALGEAQAQWDTHVALGHGEPGNSAYRKQLVKSLAPWLVPGARTAKWLHPGDVFLGLSLSETAFLAGQEAMIRGALLVVPHVGVMGELADRSAGIRTFPPGDVDAAAAAISSFAATPLDEMVQAGQQNRDLANSLVGRWYDDVGDLLRHMERN